MEVVNLDITKFTKSIYDYNIMLRFIAALLIGGIIAYTGIFVRGIFNPMFFVWSAFPETYGRTDVSRMIFISICARSGDAILLLLFYKISVSKANVILISFRLFLYFMLFMAVGSMLISIGKYIPTYYQISVVISMHALVQTTIILFMIRCIRAIYRSKNSLARDAFLREGGTSSYFFRKWIYIESMPWISFRKKSIIISLKLLALGSDILSIEAIAGLMGDPAGMQYLFSGTIHDKTVNISDEYLDKILSDRLYIFGRDIAALLLLITVANLLRSAARWLSRTPYEQVESHSTHIGTLFLRPFADDKVSFPVKGRGRWLLVFGCGTLDDLLAQRFAFHGAVVAIGKPSDVRLPTGAFRKYIADTEWQSTVAMYLHLSNTVLLAVGDTPGIGWEIDKVIEIGALQKTIFISMPGRSVIFDYFCKIGIYDERAYRQKSYKKLLCVFLCAPNRAVCIWADNQNEASYDVALRIAHIEYFVETTVTFRIRRLK
jgi:hypothetical protein